MRGTLSIAAATALLSACSPDLEPTGASALPSETDAPAVSPEIEIGGTPVPIPGVDAWAPLQLAAGDGEHLAVWTAPVPGTAFQSRIVGTRVSFDGTVLDPVGKTIAGGTLPAVAAGGDGFLVVMLDELYRPRGVRVGPDGAALDPGGFPIGNGSGSIATVAFDGTNYVVAWGESPGIRHVRVSPAGEVLGPPRFIPDVYLYYYSEWRGLACGAGRCLLAWYDGVSPTISAARIDDQGELLDPVPLAIGPTYPAPLVSPSVAFDGASFVAAWPTPEGVLAARVSPEGVVLDPDGIQVGGEIYPTTTAIAFDGASTVVAWNQDAVDPGVHVARLSPGGEVLDAEPARLTGSVDSVAIAGHGGGSFVGWSSLQFSPGAPRLAGTRLSLAGEALDAPGILLHSVANSQELPAIAGDGDGFLAAWVDTRSRGIQGAEWSSDLYAARLSPAGAVLDPAGILVAAGATSGIQPRAVFDGSSTVLLTWEFTGECAGSCLFALQAVRVSPGGRVLDATPIDLALRSPFPGPIAAASNGAGTLVVSILNGAATSVVVDPRGEIVNVRSFGTAFGEAAVASDGEGYLAVWAVGNGSETRLFGVRLGADGGVLDAGGITIAPFDGIQGRPAVGFDGERYVVAWERMQAGAGGSPHGVLAARVTRDGEVLDPGGVLIAEGGPGPLTSGAVERPVVGSDGQRAIIGWRGLADPGDPTPTVDLFGAAIGADGLPGPTFAISADAGEAGLLELGSSCGEILAVYNRFVQDPPFGAQRVMARRIDLGAGDAACAREAPEAPEAPEAAAPLLGSGGCRAAGAPAGGGGWLAAALAALLALRGGRGPRARRAAIKVRC